MGIDEPETAAVLARAGNYAVTHLPGRRFPGVHIQGDTLSVLYDGLVAAARASPSEDLDYLVASVDAALTFYERTLAERGIGLPYHRSRPEA